MANVNPPPLHIPEIEDRGLFKFLEELAFVVYQLRERSGGGTDIIAPSKSLSLFIDGPAQARISAIQSEIDNLKQMTVPGQRVESLDKRVNNLEQLNVTSITPFASQINKDIDNLNAEIAGLSSRLGPLYAGLAGVGFKVVPITTNYTAVGGEIIVCTNTAKITVTLSDDWPDGTRSYIKRSGGLVDVTTTKTIDGQAKKTIINKYDCPLLVYTTGIDEYSII